MPDLLDIKLLYYWMLSFIKFSCGSNFRSKNTEVELYKAATFTSRSVKLTASQRKHRGHDLSGTYCKSVLLIITSIKRRSDINSEAAAAGDHVVGGNKNS